MEQKFMVGIVVNNHYGVLNRVAGMFGKRGYNIDSLAVGTTEDPAYSRMTIVCAGDDYTKEQVVRQLMKLHDVKLAELLEPSDAVTSEQILIKLRAENGTNAQVSELVNSYGGKARDFGGDFITAEITGDPGRIDMFIEAARPFGILEMCRSGAISLTYGTGEMLSLENIH